MIIAYLLENGAGGLKLFCENRKGKTVMNIAEELGESLSKIAIAWCLLNENVSTIILGASKIEQLEENLKAPEALPLLTEEVQKRLGSI